jgi:hypothetical protein
MLMMAVMSTLCIAGVGFYVRFVVAMCKECKPRRSGIGCCSVFTIRRSHQLRLRN